MEIVITLTTSKPYAIFHKRHAQKMSINLKCCNLIGAATTVAARTSEVCVSHQTNASQDILVSSYSYVYS